MSYAAEKISAAARELRHLYYLERLSSERLNTAPRVKSAAASAAVVVSAAASAAAVVVKIAASAAVVATAAAVITAAAEQENQDNDPAAAISTKVVETTHNDFLLRIINSEVPLPCGASVSQYILC